MTDFRALLEALSGENVHFIVVGGAAAIAHGATRLTMDLDIVYQRDDSNISALVRALRPANPYLRGAPPGLPFLFDEMTLCRGLNFTLTTSWGDIDLLGEITGGGTYSDLQPRSITLDLFGLTCSCLSLSQLIQAKRAVGRAKDLDVLAELEALADESRDS